MDAAQVGDRSKVKVEHRYNSREEWRMRETVFDSWYPLKGHWMWTLELDGYTMTGEYALGNEQAPTVSEYLKRSKTLYRWQLDEGKRSLMNETNADLLPHIISVVIQDEVQK